jgi:hypothetical protein
MNQQAKLTLPPDIESCRSQLEQELLNAEAARQMQAALSRTDVDSGSPETGRLQRALAAMREVCAVLEGGRAWPSDVGAARPPQLIDRAEHEALVIHPREKQERRHQLTSLLGRVHHLLEGSELARVVARVTEKAGPQAFPELVALTEDCARALEVETPAIHVARGEEPLFTVMLDRSPFLCVHPAFLVSKYDLSSPNPLCLSGAERRFAVAHQLEHIKGGHAAVLQISPDRLEALVLDQLPFLVRQPVRFAARTIAWTRANEAVKKAGERLPDESRTRRVIDTVGTLLPDRNQETILPEAVHDWLRAWIQGVEYSADRAGLLLTGSLSPACAALLRLTPNLAAQPPLLRERGARWLLQQRADAGRPTIDRLYELLRFALSPEYLGFISR